MLLGIDANLTVIRVGEYWMGRSVRRSIAVYRTGRMVFLARHPMYTFNLRFGVEVCFVVVKQKDTSGIQDSQNNLRVRPRMSKSL